MTYIQIWNPGVERYYNRKDVGFEEEFFHDVIIQSFPQRTKDKRTIILCNVLDAKTEELIIGSIKRHEVIDFLAYVSNPYQEHYKQVLKDTEEYKKQQALLPPQGDKFLGADFIWAPYIPLMVTNTIFSIDNFNVTKSGTFGPLRHSFV